MPINISTIQIKASKEKVWAALTHPNLVKLWQFGSDLVTTWEPGTDIKFSVEWDGKLFEQWGRVITFLPFESLVYSLFAPRPDLEDKPENYFIMTYSLEAVEGGTRLEILQKDDRPGAKQEAPQGEENAILQSLKKVAEES